MQGFSVMMGRMLAEASGTRPGIGICKIFQTSIGRRACPATLFLVNRGTAFGPVITGKPSDGLPFLSRRLGQMRPWNTTWTFFVYGRRINPTHLPATPLRDPAISKVFIPWQSGMRRISISPFGGAAPVLAGLYHATMMEDERIKAQGRSAPSRSMGDASKKTRGVIERFPPECLVFVYQSARMDGLFLEPE